MDRSSFAAASSNRRLKKYAIALHPTVKPVALVADAILDCSARTEIGRITYQNSVTRVPQATSSTSNNIGSASIRFLFR